MQELLELGLTEKESACYIALLENGTSPTTFIAKKTKLKRATAYLTLHNLLEKGLVVKNVKGKTQYFSANDPEQLEAWLERRAKSIETKKRALPPIIQALYQRRSPLATVPKIRFFEGVEGARTALEETLKAKEEYLRVLLSVADIIEFLGEDFFLEYTDKRVKSGPSLRSIRTIEKDRKVFTDKKRARNYISSKKARREVRYISNNLQFPVNTYAFDDKLIYISSKAENFALLIQSQEISTWNKNLFNLLWETAQPYKSSLFNV